MDAARIPRWIRPRRWCVAPHHTTEAFVSESYIGNITSLCRSHPTVALENIKNLFGIQAIRCLYVSDGLECVSSSYKHFTERAGRNIADPMCDTGLVPAFGG